MSQKIFLLVFFFLSAFTTGGDSENPFAVHYDEGTFWVTPGEEVILPIQITIPKNYYLYKTKTQVTLTNFQGIELKGDPEFSPSVEKEDPFLSETVSVFFNEAIITLHLIMPSQSWPGEKILEGTIGFQGCSTSLCYKPMKIPLRVSFAINDEKVTPTTPGPSVWSGLTSILSGDNLGQNSFGLVLIVAFIWGFLTDLTGCIWPMIPVTLAIIGVRGDKKIIHNLLATFVMVLGMALMYTALGLGAQALGKAFGFQFQSTIFLVIMTGILILMGLSLLGLFDIQLPPAFQARMSRLTSTGYRGIFLVGLSLGVMASPCVGPFLIPLLTYVSASGGWLRGILVLLSYAMGMGSIFIIMGVVYTFAKIKIRSGPWNIWFKKAVGLVILLVAMSYVRTIVGNLMETPTQGLSSLSTGFQQAHEKQQPLVIDFFADWCGPCKKLDDTVWSTPEIQSIFEKDWIFVKIDCTQETPTCQEAVSRYQVVGWPTVLFVDPDGKEIHERLVGKVPSMNEMIQILKTP